MNANRRSFLFGIAGAAALVAAPKAFASRLPILWADGVHDDTEAFQALLDGKPVKLSTGETFRSGFEDGGAIHLRGGIYRVEKTLHMGRTGCRTNLSDMSIRSSAKDYALQAHSAESMRIESCHFASEAHPAAQPTFLRSSDGTAGVAFLGASSYAR